MARDLALERRVLDLRALAAEQLAGGVEEDFAWLICDRCNLRVRLSADPRRAPIVGMEKWGKGPEGDLCPTCAA